MDGVRLTLIFLGLVGYGNVATAATPAQVRGAIFGSQRTCSHFFKIRDAKKYASMYAPNAVMYEPNNEKYVGQQKIEEAVRIMMKEGVVLAFISRGFIYSGGNQAIWLGDYRLIAPGNKLVDMGKRIQTWTNINRRWRILEDTWNSNMPFGWKTHDNWALSKEIVGRLQGWANAIKLKIWPRVFSFYGNRCVNMPDGGKALFGKRAIPRVFSDNRFKGDDGRVRLNFNDDFEIKMTGRTTVTVRGTCTLGGGNGNTLRYLHVMKLLRDKKWYIITSMWTFTST